MRIRSLLPFAADVVLLGRVVEPGEVVDVSDADGAALLEQVGNWAADDDEAAPAAKGKAR